MNQALYRRYRPETFAEMIGQEHVTEPLSRALATGRVSHAYLFSGPRGCGKTTCARILARCLNCEKGPAPEPCGQCDSCRELGRAGGGSLDVEEIDAASHGGVDDSRGLREKAIFATARDRFKVFILDEAHMVSREGFNALLKIVEEPPPHVKFIFATTEPNKVLATIRSRSHHYPFRLVPPGIMTSYMEDLAAREGITADPGVMSLVVRSGGGSVRDTESVLDQLIGGSFEGHITYQHTAALLGFTPEELINRMVMALGQSDGGEMFSVVESVVESGLEPQRFAEDLLERLRDLVVLAAAGPAARQALRDLPDDQVDGLASQAAQFGLPALTKVADAVSAGLAAMAGATSPRLQLELLSARALVAAGPVDGPVVARPVDGPPVARPVDGPVAAGPVDGPVAAWPVDGPVAARPVSTAGIGSGVGSAGGASSESPPEPVPADQLAIGWAVPGVSGGPGSITPATDRQTESGGLGGPGGRGILGGRGGSGVGTAPGAGQTARQSGPGAGPAAPDGARPSVAGRPFVDWDEPEPPAARTSPVRSPKTQPSSQATAAGSPAAGPPGPTGPAGSPVAGSSPARQPGGESQPAAHRAGGTPPAAAQPDSSPGQGDGPTGDLAKQWDEIVQALRQMSVTARAMILQGARLAAAQGDTLDLIFRSPDLARSFAGRFTGPLEQAASQVAGHPVTARIWDEDSFSARPQPGLPATRQATPSAQSASPPAATPSTDPAAPPPATPSTGPALAAQPSRTASATHAAGPAAPPPATPSTGPALAAQPSRTASATPEPPAPLVPPAAWPELGDPLADDEDEIISPDDVAAAGRALTGVDLVVEILGGQIVEEIDVEDG
ncbi:MAG: DNA polymerase III subunit gamma and tau [Bifidobacteriaceae bacterium]|nr:DNA polymerase III subunit gamma and tau [Bifidobacteriaceae bacterium]